LDTKTFPLGVVQGDRTSDVNLGLPIISETTRARKLNLKIPSNMVKYPFWVQKLLHYTIQHEAAAILTFDKSLYLRGRLRL